MNLSPRRRRWLIAAVVAFVLFSVAGFFIAPPIVKAQLLKRASKLLDRTVTLGKVRVNPYTQSVTVEDFDIKERGSNASFVGWKRLYVNLDVLSSLTGSWVLSEIELDGFHASVAINPDQSYNFTDLVTRFGIPANRPDKPERPIRFVSLKVSQARIDFSDQSRKTPFKSTVGPLTFALKEFRTVGVSGAPYRFEAVTEAGESLVWTGTLSADPLESQGDFQMTGLVLKKYTPYIEGRIQSDLADGVLDLKGHYDVKFSAQSRALQLANAELHLRNFKLTEWATRQPAVEIGALDVLGLKADAVAMKLAADKVAVGGGRIVVRREQDNSLNLLTLLQPPAPAAVSVRHPSAPAATAPAAAMALPEVAIGEVAVKDLKVEIADQAAPRPAALAVSGVQLSVKNVSLADGAVMPIDLALTWAPQGTVHASGTVTIKPDLSADLKTEVTALEILPLSPYLEQFINARITQGAVTTAGAAQVSLAGGSLAANYAGDIAVTKFGLVDGANNEELAGVGELKLTGLKVATAPKLTVALDEVSIAAPYARVLVNADQSINLLAVARTDAVPAAGATAAPAELPNVRIGRVVIADGDFSFTDRSVQPNVRMAITQFGGTVSALSSENLARGDVDLKGLVDGAGPVAITGKLDPLGASKYVELKVDFKNVDLLPVSPYTGKFAGYELVRGKLAVDTKVVLEGRKLDAANVVTLNQFTFGAATNSPDATGLPVRLGVALLKDMDGKIVIDLPVQGSFDDPNFRIGKVVLRVIVNLLTKAATSPFSLLGSMFGGGGEELAFQEFAPGSSDLQPAERPKLDTMVKALANRPALSLGIEGGYDVAADTYAVKRQKWADLVRRQIWEAKHAVDPNVPPPAELVVGAEDDAAMVKKLFEAKYPPGTEFGGPPPPPPEVKVAPAPAKRGFFQRLVDALFGRGRKAALAEAVGAKPAAPTKADVQAAAAGGPTLDEMRARMADTMAVDENDLRALAAARAQRVRDYFINEGKIAGDRLFLAQGGAAAAKQDKGPRVFLNLQ